MLGDYKKNLIKTFSSGFYVRLKIHEEQNGSHNKSITRLVYHSFHDDEN
jgi:hypothetical protein